MKNSQLLPEQLVWDKTVDKHMSRLDFARYFCQSKTYGITCGMFTGGGKCQFHQGSHDSAAKQRAKKFSGYSKAYQQNRGSEEVNED
jgi:hypothetical protein